MKKLLIFIQVNIVLTTLVLAQVKAPVEWKRLSEKKVSEDENGKLVHHGIWSSSDGTQAATIIGRDFKITTPQSLRNCMAGVFSGVIQSGTYPLEYMSLEAPHLVMATRGKQARDGVAFYESTYMVLTKQGLLVMKVSHIRPKINLDLTKWSFGEPVVKFRKEYASVMKDFFKKSNDNIEKFQGMATKMNELNKNHHKKK